MTVCPPFLYGVTNCGDDSAAAVGHTDHDAITPAQGRQVLGSVEHQVRRTSKEQLVLTAGRFSFHRIDDDDAAMAGSLGNGQLHGSGKCPTTTTGEAGFLQASHETVLPGTAAAARHVEGTMGVEMPLQVSWLAQQVVDSLQRWCLAGTKGHLDAPPYSWRRVV
jgi:hypothetical protein